MMGAILRWKIGALVVTTLSDGFFPASFAMIEALDYSEAAKLQADAGRSEPLKITNNAYLIEGTDHGPILVDAGMGGTAGPTAGHLLASLALTGVPPNDIKTVLMTHLHPDHCLGLTDQSGKAVYPNADIFIHNRELSYWKEDSNFNQASEMELNYVAMTRAALKPYESRVRLIDWTSEVLPGIISVDLSGHTPGHTGYQLLSENASLLIWGDIVQFPVLQSLRPETSLVADVNQDAAVNVRKKIMQRAADEKLLVAGMHTDFPGVSRVLHQGNGFRVVPALWADHI